MSGSLEIMRDVLQEALDEFTSSRSSSEVKTAALLTLERHFALVSLSRNFSDDAHNFSALQYTFECNIPSRLLPWISYSISTLEALTSKGAMDQGSVLTSQLSSSLFLIQGVSLSHTASKAFLGRKYALQILVDLLLVSRHLSATSGPTSGSRGSSQIRPSAPLSSVVLDTLLCILVDSPAGLRAFEDVNGVQAVVKILKRAGTPREVRMKCLEFLYFYLLDETPSDGATVPAMPYHGAASKPFEDGKPFRPSSSRYGSSVEFSFMAESLRLASGSSVISSVSTCSSNISATSTTPSSLSSSPDKPSWMLRPKTSNSSLPLPHTAPLSILSYPLTMLRKDIDYVPQSPQKGLRRPHTSSGQTRTPARSLSKLQMGVSRSEDDCHVLGQPSARNEGGVTRTTEEKKAFLGTMLGNVEALVEGVRKAGIWGLC